MTNIKDIRKEWIGLKIELLQLLRRKEYKKFDKWEEKLLKLFDKHTSKILDMVTLEEIETPNIPDWLEQKDEAPFVQGYNLAKKDLDKNKETINQQCLKEVLKK